MGRKFMSLNTDYTEYYLLVQWTLQMKAAKLMPHFQQAAHAHTNIYMYVQRSIFFFARTLLVNYAKFAFYLIF